jgi:hypothetical protein
MIRTLPDFVFGPFPVTGWFLNSTATGSSHQIAKASIAVWLRGAVVDYANYDAAYNEETILSMQGGSKLFAGHDQRRSIV